MTQLHYDPGEGKKFWNAIQKLPGYPLEEGMPIREMLFASGAIFQLPRVFNEIGADPTKHILVVMDPTEMQRGEESLKPLVLRILKDAGWQVEPVVLEPDATGQVHTDMPHIEDVKARIYPGYAVLALGSGTVTDITKHACYLYKEDTGEQPTFVVYPTANSVSAYTSSMAPTFIDGVKRTLSSRYPDAVVCDTETLRDAPREMTVAGVGDMLAVYVSFPDWFLANKLGLDPGYARLPELLVGQMDEILLEKAEDIREGNSEGMEVLAKLIAIGGLCMSLMHVTTPMSGLEHVMSHVLDMQAEAAGQPLAQHGTQVALTTLLALDTYERFLANFDPAKVDLDACYPSTKEMEQKVRQAFAVIDPTGKVGSECWSDYRLKLKAWREHRAELESFLVDWPAIKPEIERRTCPPERLVDILLAVGSSLTFAELFPPAKEEQVKFAYLNAPLMRKRLTIGDLWIFLGWDREKLWSEAWQCSQARKPANRGR